MEKKNGKFNFRLMCSLGKLNDEQFKVMFFILNTINLGGGGRTKIYRAVLADITGKSERTITRITDKLAEQGLIVKDYVSDGSKTYNYYSLPVSNNNTKPDNGEQKTKSNLVTDDTLNTINKIYTNNTIYTKGYILDQNIYKRIYTEKEYIQKKKEDISNDISKKKESEKPEDTSMKRFEIMCTEPIDEVVPDEESLADYQKRMERKKAYSSIY